MSLHKKIEDMAVAWLTSRNIGTDEIYPGKNSLTKAGQCVVCFVEKSAEYPANSNNHKAVLKIIVTTPFREAADDTSHGTITANAFDSWHVSDTENPNYLAEQLSSLVDDFTVFGFFTPEVTQESGPDDKNRWQDEKRIGIYCAGSDIE